MTKVLIKKMQQSRKKNKKRSLCHWNFNRRVSTLAAISSLNKHDIIKRTAAARQTPHEN